MKDLFDCLRGIGHDALSLTGLIDKRTFYVGSTQLGAAAEEMERPRAGAKYNELIEQSIGIKK